MATTYDDERYWEDIVISPVNSWRLTLADLQQLPSSKLFSPKDEVKRYLDLLRYMFRLHQKLTFRSRVFWNASTLFYRYYSDFPLEPRGFTDVGKCTAMMLLASKACENHRRIEDFLEVMYFYLYPEKKTRGKPNQTSKEWWIVRDLVIQQEREIMVKIVDICMPNPFTMLEQVLLQTYPRNDDDVEFYQHVREIGDPVNRLMGQLAFTPLCLVYDQPVDTVVLILIVIMIQSNKKFPRNFFADIMEVEVDIGKLLDMRDAVHSIRDWFGEGVRETEIDLRCITRENIEKVLDEHPEELVEEKKNYMEYKRKKEALYWLYDQGQWKVPPKGETKIIKSVQPDALAVTSHAESTISNRATPVETPVETPVRTPAESATETQTETGIGSVYDDNSSKLEDITAPVESVAPVQRPLGSEITTEKANAPEKLEVDEKSTTKPKPTQQIFMSQQNKIFMSKRPKREVSMPRPSQEPARVMMLDIHEPVDAVVKKPAKKVSVDHSSTVIKHAELKDEDSKKRKADD